MTQYSADIIVYAPYVAILICFVSFISLMINEVSLFVRSNYVIKILSSLILIQGWFALSSLAGNIAAGYHDASVCEWFVLGQFICFILLLFTSIFR